MHVLELTALVVAATVTVVRAPHAVTSPQARLSWGAICIAAVAFLARVQVGLDRYLGGTNVISLVQNVCAVSAFWLLTQAALNQHHRRPIRWWQLPVLLAAFVAPFLCITNRGTTSDTFIVDTIAQTSTWLYASIYMAVFALIAVSLIAGLRRRRSRSYRFFLAGSSIVSAACVDEITSLTLDHLDAANLVLRDVLRDLFGVLFYPGAMLVIVGVASFTSLRFGREQLLRHRIRTLDRLCTELGVVTRQEPAVRGARQPVLDLYIRVIALRDHEIANRASLPAAGSRDLDAAEQLVMRYLVGPPALPGTPMRDARQDAA